MRICIKSLRTHLYILWLRSRLNNCARGLRIIAAQRDNDFYAEGLLHKEMTAVRSKLQLFQRNAETCNGNRVTGQSPYLVGGIKFKRHKPHIVDRRGIKGYQAD